MKPSIELHYVEGTGHWLATHDLQVPGFRSIPTWLHRLAGDDHVFSKDVWDRFQAWVVESGLRVRPQAGLVLFMRDKKLALDPRQASSTLPVKLDALVIDGVPYLACHDKTPLPPVKRLFHRITLYWSRRAKKAAALQPVFDRLSRDFTIDNSGQLLGFLRRPAPEPSETGRTTAPTEQLRIKALDRRDGISWLPSGQIEILVANRDLAHRLDHAQTPTLQWLERRTAKLQTQLDHLVKSAQAESRAVQKARLTDRAAAAKQQLAVAVQQLERVRRQTPGRYFPGRGRLMKALRTAARRQHPEAGWLIFRGTHDVTIARADDDVFLGKAFRYEPLRQGPEFPEFDLKL